MKKALLRGPFSKLTIVSYDFLRRAAAKPRRPKPAIAKVPGAETKDTPADEACTIDT